MAIKGNNKGSYVVMLEQAKQPPKLITSVKPLGGNKYHLALIHPNTKKIVVERKDETCASLDEAMKKANALRDLPEAKEAKTWYEETLFIPQPKRGKMKLKTKEVVEEELNQETEASTSANIKKAKKTTKKASKVKKQVKKVQKKSSGRKKLKKKK